MRDFAEGVILQDYAKVESSESGKSLLKKTPGSLSLRFKDIEKFFGSLLPEGVSYYIMIAKSVVLFCTYALLSLRIDLQQHQFVSWY